jgi:hypothetical protein
MTNTIGLGGATNCTVCTAGKYGTSSIAECIACQAGKIGSSTGATSEASACTSCPVGKFSSEAAQTLCSSCPAGMAMTAATEDSRTNANWCLDCDAGKYAVVGQPSCIECPAAYFGDNTNMVSCIACPLGQYSDPGSSSILLCTEEASCDNKIQDGTESGVDCGGAGCDACPTKAVLAFDDYFDGCLVYADCNLDGVRNTVTTTTTTAEAACTVVEGKCTIVSLHVDETLDACLLVLDPDSQPDSCIDAGTGVRPQIRLTSAAAGTTASSVSILTTLKKSIVDSSASYSITAADSAVKVALGGGMLQVCNLDADDPIAIVSSASVSDAVRAAAVHHIGVASQVQGLLLQATSAIDGSSQQRRRRLGLDHSDHNGRALSSTGVDAAFAALAATVQTAHTTNAQVDLSDKDTLKGVIREAYIAVNPGDSADADVDANLDAIASSVAAVNQMTQEVTNTASATPGSFDAGQLVRDLNAQNYMQQAQLAEETAGLMMGKSDITTFAANTRPEVMLPAAKEQVNAIQNQRFPVSYKSEYIQRLLEWKFKNDEEQIYTIAGISAIGLAIISILLVVRIRMRRNRAAKVEKRKFTKSKVEVGSPEGVRSPGAASAFDDSFNDSINRIGTAPPLKLADVEPRLSEYGHKRAAGVVSPNSASVLDQEFGNQWQNQPPPPPGQDEYGDQGYDQEYENSPYRNSNGAGYAGSPYGRDGYEDRGGAYDDGYGGGGGYAGAEGPPISAAAAAVMDQMSGSRGRPGMDSRDESNAPPISAAAQAAMLRYSSSQPGSGSRHSSRAVPNDAYARGAAPIPIGQLNPSMQQYSSANDDGYDL